MSPRLTPASYIILGLVHKFGPSSPYDVKRAAAGSVSRYWSLPHAQVYAQCDRLVELGLLDQVQEQTGRRRRVLTLTEEGERLLREWIGQDARDDIELRDLGLVRLYFGAPVQEVAPQEITWHEERLAELEARQQAGDDSPTLVFGLNIERAYIDTWKQVLASA